jgi:signal transduction histidine kinase
MSTIHHEKSFGDLIEIINFTESISTKIHGVLDKRKIFKIVKQEFIKSNRYTVAIMSLNDEGSKLFISVVSLSPKIIKAAEKGTGLRLNEFKIDLEKSNIYRQVVREGKTLQVNVMDIVNELFPRVLALIIEKLIDFVKEQAILAPLRRNGKVMGVLLVSSTELAEYFIPSVNNLAQHISSGFAIADEYSERKRVEAKLKQSEKKLREHSEQLERLVEERTKELVISMEQIENVRALGEAVSSAPTLEERMILVSKMIVENLEFGFAGVILYDRHLQTLRQSTFYPLGQQLRKIERITGRNPMNMDIPYEPGVNLYIDKLMAGESVVGQKVADMMTPPLPRMIPDTFQSLLKIGSYVMIPLDVESEIVGFLLVMSHEPDIKSKNVNILRVVGRQIGAALENARNLESLQKKALELETVLIELRRTQEKLVHREKLVVLGKLAGGVSHELRNPLGVIANSVYILKQELTDANGNVNEYLDMIDAEIKVSNKIISDLLDFGRIRVPIFENVSVVELVDQVLERFPPPKDVVISLNIPDDFPDIIVDPGQVDQVLNNLVVNAYQAMPEGGSLSIVGQTMDERALLSIKDTGIGISNEGLDKLFEPFITTKSAGVGLGLVVTKILVEANQGTINVESKKGEGTTLTLILPTEKEIHEQ